MKKKLISMLAVCSVACCIAGGVQSVQAKAEDYSSALSMVKGAYVRVDTSSAFHNGIKFEATMDKDVYDTLESDKVDYGMVIVPLDYGEITKDNLFGAERKYYIEGVTEDTGNLKELGGGFVSKLQEYSKDSTKMVLEGSIVNIAPSQLTREFVGVPFIRIDNEYYVGAYGGEEYARSMVYVAQKGIEMGKVTPEQETYLTKNYLTYKDDTVDVASKQYTYTVEHIKLAPDGEVLATETVTGEKTTLNTEVSATENTYDNYTYDAEKSKTSDIVYANNRTTLKFYYVQNHVNVTFKNGAGCTMTPDDEKYAGKNYVLLEDGTFNFTVTPPADYNKHTQQIYVFKNDAKKPLPGYAEGKYTIDLSSCQNGDTITLGGMVGDFKPTLDAGKGNYRALVSVTQEESTGIYTYTNKTPGLDTGTNRNWGESGFYFNGVFDLTQNANAQLNQFFHKGYKYVRFDLKFADNVTGYNVRVVDTTYQMDFGANYDAKSEIVKVVNSAGSVVTKVEKDVWLTFYVQPTKGQMWTLWTDGGSAENPSIAYVKNIEYLEEMPTVFPTLAVKTEYASLETSSDLGGTYKYTNTSLGRAGSRWGDAGIYFEEVFASGKPHTFFASGYQFITIDFCATESVYSIDFQNGWSVNGNTWIEQVKETSSAFNSDVFAIYNEQGEKVNKWTKDTWYTLVIKPLSTGEVLRIQTNAETSTSAAPVMYVRNISYEKANPFVLPVLDVNANLASLEIESSGTFAGAYKYTNTSLGEKCGQYGEAGIHFNEIFHFDTGRSNVFHDAGYQYITLNFYAESTVYSISFCENWGVNATNSFTITAGQTFSDDDIFAIYNANGEKVNTWTAGEWYTLVIKPTATVDAWNPPLRIQTNAETATSDAPVMYLKNVTYCVENPYAN